MTTRMLIDIIANDKTKKALTSVQTRLGNVKSSVFSLKGAFIGLGAGAVIKSFVDVGKEVESLQVRFKFLFGSVDEGAIAFDNLTKFAARVPFSLDEISRASGNLAVVAKDANDLNRILEITGNVAAVTGLDFETTSSQIQRAFSGGIGAADLFRERGVRALLGFQAGAKVTANETIKRFEKLFSGNGQFANATKDLAQTLEGTISMIGDKYFKFQKDVAAGFFDELKGEFGDLNVFLEKNEQQIKDIATAIGKNFAGAITTTSDLIKGVAPAVKNVADALGTTIDGFKSLPTFVQTSGLIAALLFGKKGALAFGALSFLVGQIDDLIDKSKEAGEIKLLSVDDLKEEADSLEKVNFYLNYFNNKLDPSITKSRQKRDVIKEKVSALESLKEMYISNANELDLFDRILKNSTQSTNDAATSVNLLRQAQDEYVKVGISMRDILEKEKIKEKQLLIEASKGYSIVNTELRAYNASLQDNSKLIAEINEQKMPRFQQTLEDAGDITKQLDGLFTNTFNSFADTLANSIMTGKFAFKDFARSVIADIAKIIARQQALLIVQKATGFFGGAGGTSGGIVSSIGKIFGFADGGNPPVNRPSIIGERGAELFVPKSSGTIIPNEKLSGMSSTTNINFTINTVDSRGVDELLTNRRSTIINVINDALNRQGKEALV